MFGLQGKLLTRITSKYQSECIQIIISLFFGGGGGFQMNESIVFLLKDFKLLINFVNALAKWMNYICENNLNLGNFFQISWKGKELHNYMMIHSWLLRCSTASGSSTGGFPSRSH